MILKHVYQKKFFDQTPFPEWAQKCPSKRNLCKLPACFCSRLGMDIPGELKVLETPQMILIGFEKSITDCGINFYKSLFSGNCKNPTNCSISGTFFVEHEYNNYDQTQWLFSNGHEIGVRSFR